MIYLHTLFLKKMHCGCVNIIYEWTLKAGGGLNRAIVRILVLGGLKVFLFLVLFSLTRALSMSDGGKRNINFVITEGIWQCQDQVE